MKPLMQPSEVRFCSGGIGGIRSDGGPFARYGRREQERFWGRALVFYLGVFLFCRVLRIGGPGALD
jgi:hypothetical protein